MSRNRPSARKRRNAKATIIARDGLVCWMCGAKLTAETATLDHVHPISRGGTNAQTNLRIACQPCNLGRGNAPAFPLTDKQRRLMGKS